MIVTNFHFIVFAHFRFMQVQTCGQSCTSIASGLKRPREYLVGLVDSSVKCYTTGWKNIVRLLH